MTTEWQRSRADARGSQHSFEFYQGASNSTSSTRTCAQSGRYVNWQHAPAACARRMTAFAIPGPRQLTSINANYASGAALSFNSPFSTANLAVIPAVNVPLRICSASGASMYLARVRFMGRAPSVTS